MRVIDETYEDLKRQGVEHDMIFTFRGPSARLVSADRTDVPLDKEAVYEEIAEQIKALLAKPNVLMKVCSITTRLAGIDNKTLLPGIDLIGNTFVSQIGYQSKGYATITKMDARLVIDALGADRSMLDVVERAGSAEQRDDFCRIRIGHR